MAAENESKKPVEPKASRPWMPYYPPMQDADQGKGLLPWQWARERLVKSHNYMISTTRPDSSPHMVPVWGIWLDEKFYFSTSRSSRKGRNLAANPNCVVCNEDLHEVVIVEGVAEELPDNAIPVPLYDAYPVKYPPWKLDPSLGPIFVVHPRVVFGFPESDFTEASTRWHFS